VTCTCQRNGRRGWIRDPQCSTHGDGVLKTPSTEALAKSLRRVASAIREVADDDSRWHSYANICDHASERLDELAATKSTPTPV
jgi:hypothetical protein